MVLGMRMYSALAPIPTVVTLSPMQTPGMSPPVATTSPLTRDREPARFGRPQLLKQPVAISVQVTPQMPQAFTLSRTSPVASSGFSMSSHRTSLGPWNTKLS